MKQSIFNTYNEIPEVDRNENNYMQVNAPGKPNHGKWVLQLDVNHPVLVNNTNLKTEKTNKETQHQQAIQAKEAEISGLKAQIGTGGGLPAGHVAVSNEDFQTLQNIKSLNVKFDDLKEAVTEFPKLKAKESESAVDVQLTEVAEYLKWNPQAFIKLAKDAGIVNRLDERKIKDAKNNEVKHIFVKPAEGQSGEAENLTEFVEKNTNFKPFLSSLYNTAPADKSDKNTVRIPKQQTGGEQEKISAGKTFINRRYGKKEDK